MPVKHCALEMVDFVGTRPAELRKNPAELLGQGIPLEHIDVGVLKENSKEIEYHGALQSPALPVRGSGRRKAIDWHVQ